MEMIVAKALPLGLVLLMLAVGLRLRLAGLRAVRGRALGAGVAAQLVALPLAGYALGLAFGLSPEMRAGLMLAAAAPGGVSSNYITLLARGDLALSALMTLITTTLAGVSLPLVMALAGHPVGSGIAPVALKMAAVTTVPMLLAMALAAFAPAGAALLSRGLEPLAKAAFVLIVLATFWQNRAALAQGLGALGLAVLSLNLAALALGAVAARAARLSLPEGRAVVVELSLQNVALAIFVATSLMARPELAVPGLIYAVVMNLTALALLARYRSA